MLLLYPNMVPGIEDVAGGSKVGVVTTVNGWTVSGVWTASKKSSRIAFPNLSSTTIALALSLFSSKTWIVLTQVKVNSVLLASVPSSSVAWVSSGIPNLPLSRQTYLYLPSVPFVRYPIAKSLSFLAPSTNIPKRDTNVWPVIIA